MATAGPLVNNVIAPWAFGIYGMFNPGAQSANKGDYPYNDYDVSQPPAVNLPDWVRNGGTPSSGNQSSFGTFGSPATFGGANNTASTFAGGRTPLPGRPSGNTGGTPRGFGNGGTPSPGAGTASPYGTGAAAGVNGMPDMQSAMAMYWNLAANRGLQAPQSQEEQLGRAFAQQKWGNANTDFDNYFENTLPGGANVTIRKWQNRGMGGFDPTGNYVGGQNGPLYQEGLKQIALQGLNKYNDPNAWSGESIGFNRQAVSDANAVVGLAPGEADKALQGAIWNRRQSWNNPTQVAKWFMGSISPYNEYFRQSLGSPESWASGMNSTMQPFANARLGGANVAFKDAQEAGLNLASQRDAAGYDPMAVAQQGVTDTAALGNRYEDSLMRAIDAESKRSLATQTPEVAAQMAAAGYGESGSGQSAMGQLQAQILEQANRDKIRALSDLRQQSLGQQAQAISQRTGIGGQNASDVLNLAGQTYTTGFDARENARNQIFGQQAGAAQQAYMGGLGAQQDQLSQMYGTTVGGAANLYGQQVAAGNSMDDQIMQARTNAISQMQRDAWNARNQTLGQTYGASIDLLGRGLDAQAQRQSENARLMQQALFGSEDAQNRKAMSQFQVNMGALGMGNQMFNARRQNELDAMNLALGFGTRGQEYDQQYRNQIADLLLMPYKTGMQISTGINTSPVGGGYRVSPWAQMGANVGGQVLGGMLGGGGNVGAQGYGLFNGPLVED